MAIGLIGLILKGRYCVLEQLGRGGEGCLYLARDMELGVLRAVKEIPVSQKKEAKLLRLLEHPSLPKMTDYIEKENFCYLVMEYIRGKSLGEWLREGREFSLEEILDYGIVICEVLQYLHEQKPPVYYGDLKPDNLMLTSEGRLYLVDLGSAELGFDSGRKRACTGTRGYAAPEQYHGEMSVASDIYAFGRTLWVLCAQKRWRYMLCCPELLLLLIKCCQREKQRRPEDFRKVRQILLRIRGRQNPRKSGVWFSVLLGGTAICAAAAFFIAGVNHKPPLETALKEVTDLYYQEEFMENEGEARREICGEAEQKLQQLLKAYPQTEAQRKILLLLALNGELQEEYKRAALYYEQLLLYDPGYKEAYGEYGLFLCRRGQQEQAEKLLEKYREQGESGGTEENPQKNVRLWLKQMEVWENEKESKKD